MPCLSSKFNPQTGPLINIGVSPVNNLEPNSIATVQTTSFLALIDTGASSTCISSQVAQVIGLRPIGMQPMISATHSVPVHTYLVNLLLPFGSAGLIVPSIQVLEFMPASGCPFQILLGRDIICKGIFTLSFDGHFTFSI